MKSHFQEEEVEENQDIRPSSNHRKTHSSSSTKGNLKLSKIGFSSASMTSNSQSGSKSASISGSKSGSKSTVGVVLKKAVKKPLATDDENTATSLLFRSTSLPPMPKWDVFEPSNTNTFLVTPSPATPGTFLKHLEEATDHISMRKKSLPKHYIKIIQDSPRGVVDRLERLASTLSAADVQSYTTLVEHSRQAKNFIWHSRRSDPIAIWPDWHDSIQPSIQASPHSPVAATTTPYQRGRSPVLSPLPVGTRSLSPYKLAGAAVGSSAGDDTSSDHSDGESRGSVRRKGLSIVTQTPPPNTPKLHRSHSDGDLRAYLKGFTSLKASLALAQVGCNNEISRILQDLQDFLERNANSPSKEKKVVRTGSSSSLKDVGSSVVSLKKELLVKRTGSTQSLGQSTNSLSSSRGTISQAKLRKREESEGSNEEDGRRLVSAVYALVSTAQAILDLDINALTTPSVPQHYVAEILKLQAIWTSNPLWPLHHVVVRLLIVFASVARLAQHFEEDFRSWNNLFLPATRKQALSMHPRRDSLKLDSPLSILQSDYESDSDSPRRLRKADKESVKALRDAVDEDTSMNVLMEWSSSGRVSFISPAVQKVFMYTQMEVLSSPGVVFVPESAVFKEMAASASRDKPNLEMCIDARRSDGRAVKIECHGLVNFDSAGVMQNVVWLLRPVKLGRAEDSPSLLSMDFMNRINETEAIPNLGMALCNICDKSVPAIHFSIHTEICLKVHKTEMDLMLLNDEMKTLRKNCDDKIDSLKREIELLKAEIQQYKSQPDASIDVEEQEKILEWFTKLFAFGTSVTDCLEQLLAIKIPKQEFLGIFYDELFDAIGWSYPDESEMFVFPGDDCLFGPDFSQIGKSCRALYEQKREMTNLIIQELLAYLECLEAEHLLTIEIGYQTAATLPGDTKFEVKEIGGVLVNVPSMQNLDGGHYSKESLFFQPYSPSSPLASSSYSEDSSPPPSSSIDSSSPYTHQSYESNRKKSKKPIVLRIQTDTEAIEGPLPRRSSFGNTRMVVGDKSIEVDLESILSPSRGSSNRSSLLSPRASQLGPAPLIAPVVAPVSHPAPLASSTGSNSRVSSPYTQTARGSSFSMPTGPQVMPRGNSFQPLMRASNAMRQGLFHTNPSTPVGSTANLNLPRAFSISQGGSPSTAVSQPSIKDYEIIKPISKGAFGSVFLAKKKISGQYFAIKVLRKSDMVAKNQASNIKSERTILTQLDSPYVVKLFSTFQSKNHIYLVMEYLNGGDCAALLKSMGQLDEDWARQYITEMVEGLAFLHERDIVHRDLKPDNMLIDVSGHIKLTDFGLSKAGFLGRRAIGVGDVGISRPATNSRGESYSGSVVTPSVSSLRHDRRDSGSSNFSIDSSMTNKDKEERAKKMAVGTPDYLAPESILGLGQGVSVDWWACGVILYEFLYGIPPFNAETPPLVFENILLHKIDWLDEELDISPEARELMEGLMCHDVEKRIGTNSSDEVKEMAWFKETDWENLSDQKVFFVPTVKNIEDTDYFDSRGVQKPAALSDSDESVENLAAVSESAMSEEKEGADFGEAVMKNLPLLEKANQKTMNKINQDFPEGEAWMQKRRDSLPMALSLPYGQMPHSPSLASPATSGPLRSVSPLHFSSVMRRDSLPVTSTSTSPSSPTKSSPKKSSRLISSASMENVWQNKLDYVSVGSIPRSSVDIGSGSLQSSRENSSFLIEYPREGEDNESSRKRSQAYLDIAKQNLINQHTHSAESSFHAVTTSALSSPNISEDSSPESPISPIAPPLIDVLIAESNPAASLVLENILRTVGCRCVRVKSGAEVVQCAMGEIKFSIIFCDSTLPVMNGDAAARMIKSTTNINSKTPIVLLTPSAVEDLEEGVVAEFDHVITKPVTHANVITALKKTLE